MTVTEPTTLDLAEARDAVDRILRDFLAGKAETNRGTRLPDAAGDLRDMVAAGGKRIRPLLCLCGWQAAGAPGDREPVLRIAASLELFHTFALIHDDIIDASATRRGRPTMHEVLAARASGGPAEAGRFGASAALLVGDLALTWSDEMFSTAQPAASRRESARGVFNEMRSEVILGQYLDLLATGRLSDDVGTALRVIRYKTAKYTIERPLHIGAALAGAGPDVLDACTGYALPMGEAFQLRDDLLGVFGDPAVTGKPVLDDLREGKATVLIAAAMQRATARQRETLLRLVGDPDLQESAAGTVRDILIDTGARLRVEAMIEERVRAALAGLDNAPFHPAATALLRNLVGTITTRVS